MAAPDLDITLHELGDCALQWGTDKLGSTGENTSLTVEDEVSETKCTQLGSTPTKRYIVGRRCEVEVSLAEPDLRRVGIVLNTTQTTGSGTNYVLIQTPIGGQELTAKELIIRKYVDNLVSGDEADSIHIFQATLSSAVELGFGPDAQRMLKCLFVALPDPNNGMALGYFGDKTA